MDKNSPRLLIFMMEQHNEILVKNPESKRNRLGYLRIAVRDAKDNTTPVNALREILGK